MYPPYCYFCAHVALILLVLCPIEAHYFYFFALTLLLLCSLALTILWPLIRLYIQRRSFQFYNPRIFHLCNVKEVPPLKRIIFNSLIYICVRWLHNTTVYNCKYKCAFSIHSTRQFEFHAWLGLFLVDSLVN